MEINKIEQEYNELLEKIKTPAKLGDGEYQGYIRRVKELSPIISEFEEYKKVERKLKEAEEIIEENKDPELSELAREELSELREKLNQIEENFKQLLSADGEKAEHLKGAIVEIRAGTGGEEASLFARDLFQMYSRYAERKGWKMEVMHSHQSEIGGFKEIILGMEGGNVYSEMRHEGGVHRVQRIPATESSGRIHTSTVTVAVLPEMEEIQLKINPKDLRVDTFRASGAGGQHVNVTDSAIRITHISTGITVQCQDERSQHKNRAKAMRILRARLTEHLQREKELKISKDRTLQVKTGDRSQKIRTYNFPQNRVTDHRINLSLHKLESIIKGELGELFSALEKVNNAS
jgi:peptide chain release factor 1